MIVKKTINSQDPNNESFCVVLCENTFSDIGHTEKKGIYLLNVSTQEVLACVTPGYLKTKPCTLYLYDSKTDSQGT